MSFAVNDFAVNDDGPVPAGTNHPRPLIVFRYGQTLTRDHRRVFCERPVTPPGREPTLLVIFPSTIRKRTERPPT